jgi:hypothetical protein
VETQNMIIPTIEGGKAMRITADMKIRQVLAIDEEKMFRAFLWLSPVFDRLRHPMLRKAMSGRVTVSQAARIAQIPLTEALYVLNLAAGEDSGEIAVELECLPKSDFEYHESNPPLKPREIRGISDRGENVIFVDVMKQHDRHEDPLPKIIRGFFDLKKLPERVLLVHHPFDPIPLRDLFAREGFASWAEERRPMDWYIYFYRPTASEGAIAHPPIFNQVFVKAAGAW